MSSPQAWGCFCYIGALTFESAVFPTGVGVFPKKSMPKALLPSLPHRRGGVSQVYPLAMCAWSSSPQAWGCFHEQLISEQEMAVFPTGVGVFPYRDTLTSKAIRLPHRRGGVSTKSGSRMFTRPSSPQAWGCFFYMRSILPHQPVFPTGVGVFLSILVVISILMRLPHRRGGVSLL